MNPMREIRIEKVTLNMGCGDDKEKLKRSEKLLKKISKQKPMITKTHNRTSFGMASKRPIGIKVTLRKEEAKRVLKDVLVAVDNTLKEDQIGTGNFSIGLKEYIDLPNVPYDPDIGIIGLDVCITLERPGFKVKKRRAKKSKIGKNHLITKEESIEWLKNNLGVEIVGR